MDTWVEVKELPSQFKMYGHLAKIEFRPYKYGEVKALSDPSLAESEKDRIMLEGIRCNKMPNTEILYDDYRMILLYRVMTTLRTERFDVPYEDKGEKRVAKMRLDQIEFEDIKVPDLPIVLEVFDQEIKLSPPTVSRFIEYKDLELDDDLYLFIQAENITEAKKIIDDLDQGTALDIKEIVDKHLRTRAFVRIQTSEGEKTVTVAVKTVHPFREETRSSAVRIKSNLT